VECKENRITGCIRLFIKPFLSSPHRLHYFFLKRIPIAFIIVSLDSISYSLFISTSVLEHIIAPTNLIINNFFQAILILCFYCERFFLSIARPTLHSLAVSAPLVGPCVFGTLLPTNPARVATAAPYQCTYVPPYLTLVPLIIY
jgi:hypothetical protein